LPDEIRPLSIERDYTRYAHGSVLVKAGETRVLCTAMIEDTVPPHCRGRNMGWLSCEYCMLPSSNPIRKSLQREPDGRVREIQRLIGRSLRMAVDLGQVGERTIWIDCNVIQADGSTRTASVTGGFVALVDALWRLRDKGKIAALPVKHSIAAVSVGIVDGLPVLDLTSAEDQQASVDMNVVMTHDEKFVEVQGTAESEPFGAGELKTLLELARKGIEEIKRVQFDALKEHLTI
jgi:ribonuclease PH